MDVCKSSFVLYLSFLLIVLISAKESNNAMFWEDENNEYKLEFESRKVRINGFVGSKGEKGETGVPGDEGSKGIKGDKGLPGAKGSLGLRPMMGFKGIQGDPGAVGNPGPEGPMGSCGQDLDVEDGVPEYGTEEETRPICRFAPVDTPPGTYNIGPGHAIQVECNDFKETCIKSKKSGGVPYNTGSKNRPFWFSEIQKDMFETVYGLTREQVKWLQKQSTYIRQTLRYHCLDSYVPYSRNELTSSIRLLAWNDVVIGPYPTEKTPFFYSVPPETDNCSNHKLNETTDIVLLSTNTYRLPIEDVLIGHISQDVRKFSLENVEICFG